MSSLFEKHSHDLRARPRRWLVTGAAGFIGSHLVECLLRNGQRVVGVDNFATGSRFNLEDVTARVGESAGLFEFVEGDLCDAAVCRRVADGADVVLHQAALGSVPRSISDPIATHHANLTSFVNLLIASRDAGVSRLVYASSSSVYGDEPNLPKKEEVIGRPLSPYAVTKRGNELYADAFHGLFGIPIVGLRYFNVFGPRQDPAGPYAAVIPRWIGNLLSGQRCTIFGDGLTSRDFCFVDNAVQANLLAATVVSRGHRVYNVACGARTTLDELFRIIAAEAVPYRPEAAKHEPEYEDFRAGDVRHSEADISAITRDLGYRPTHSVREGMRETVRWYANQPRFSVGSTADGTASAQADMPSM